MMPTFDVYCRYVVQADSIDHALERWDAGEASFAEWEDVIEVIEPKGAA